MDERKFYLWLICRWPGSKKFLKLLGFIVVESCATIGGGNIEMNFLLPIIAYQVHLLYTHAPYNFWENLAQLPLQYVPLFLLRRTWCRKFLLGSIPALLPYHLRLSLATFCTRTETLVTCTHWPALWFAPTPNASQASCRSCHVQFGSFWCFLQRFLALWTRILSTFALFWSQKFSAILKCRRRIILSLNVYFYVNLPISRPCFLIFLLFEFNSSKIHVFGTNIRFLCWKLESIPSLEKINDSSKLSFLQKYWLDFLYQGLNQQTPVDEGPPKKVCQKAQKVEIFANTQIQFSPKPHVSVA